MGLSGVAGEVAAAPACVPFGEGFDDAVELGADARGGVSDEQPLATVPSSATVTSIARTAFRIFIRRNVDASGSVEHGNCILRRRRALANCIRADSGESRRDEGIDRGWLTGWGNLFSCNWGRHS